MELQIIEWLRARFPASSNVVLGIGDDAAVLQGRVDDEWIVTTDMLLEGVHFLRGTTPLRDVGRKALAVNLSDVAAMAARPMAAFVSLGLPRDCGMDEVREIYEGMSALASQFQTTIAGGDTNYWDGRLVINVALVATCPRQQALRRSGARPGDALLVTGDLGGSLQGKHITFQPRVFEALALRRACALHAGCDISDGLAIDLWRMTQASGCGAVVEECQIPVSDQARSSAAQSGAVKSPLEHALSDGEDFELLLAVDAGDADRLLAHPPIDIPLTRIGYCVAEAGLWLVDQHGVRRELEPRGYEHGEGAEQ